MKKSLVISGLMACTLMLSTGVNAQEKTTSQTGIIDPAIQIKTLLETLEQKHPEEQALIFRLREKIDYSNKLIEYKTRAQLKSVSKVRSSGNLYAGTEGLSDGALIKALNRICAVQVPIDYQAAQEVVFTQIDNHAGEVECVYTGKHIKTTVEPDAKIMNIEHTWPQSKGAKGIAKSDLHHLYPADSFANCTRSSYCFGNVTSPKWEGGGSKFGGDVFEVRPQHRGNVARSMFYFSVRYGIPIGDPEEKALREWNKQDPVDDAEKARCDGIENVQHNRNPFVDHPEFSDKISNF